MKKSRIYWIVIALFTTASIVSCGRTATSPTSEADAASDTATTAKIAEEVTEDTTAEVTKANDITVLKAAALETYANIAYASYADSLELAIAMRGAIAAFVAEPSTETHQAAKDAWLAANEPYGQTEAYRFYGGPIDGEDGPEALMNAWPLDEAYVDYVEGNESAGIINNVEQFPAIDADLLISLNEVGAEENISTGYHAIEFLLWGQDQSAETNGQRPYTDYVTDGSGTAANQNRRAAYLSAAADLLVGHLGDMTNAWAPDQADNYRAEFLAMNPDDAMVMVLTGVGTLSRAELAGERMFAAYDNQDQEDEHSCFSDNTHRDMVTNNQGVYNVYHGRYTRIDGSEVSGPSITDVVAAVDPALNDEMIGLLDLSTTQIDAIPVPFDQAIIEPDQRQSVLDAVFTLQDQGDKIVSIAVALGLTISTALPE